LFNLQSILGRYINPDSIIKRYNSAKDRRLPLEQKWQMIQDQVFPNYRDYINRSATNAAMRPQTSKIKNHSGIVSGKINKVRS
jgi:hypothetical protein